MKNSNLDSIQRKQIQRYHKIFQELSFSKDALNAKVTPVSREHEQYLRRITSKAMETVLQLRNRRTDFQP